MYPTSQNQRHAVYQVDVFRCPKFINNTLITVMPPKIGSVHVECSTMINIMASSTEAELGGFLENFQKETSIRTVIA